MPSAWAKLQQMGYYMVTLDTDERGRCIRWIYKDWIPVAKCDDYLTGEDSLRLARRFAEDELEYLKQKEGQ